MKFCTTLFVYLALIFQLLLQGGFSPHAPTILIIPLATLQGLKVGTSTGNSFCSVVHTVLNAAVHRECSCWHGSKKVEVMVLTTET